jgi:thioredoxin-like negative regulator of GroEL
MSIRTVSRLHLSPGVLVAVLAALLMGAVERAAAQTSPFLSSGWAELRWRTDYNSARKEAAEKGLPLIIDFGTENCVYCRKLEATTFRDPRVATLMNNRFVLLKIDADREPALANHLNIRSYPTLYFADSSGKIIQVVSGFKEADEFHEIIQASLSRIPPPDGLQQDYQAAVQQTQQRNYAAALPVFRSIAADPRARQLQPQAQKYVELIEQQAAERVAAARDLEAKGRIQDALDAVEDAVRSYPGTEATRQAAQTVSRLKDSALDRAAALRLQRARELLVQARDFQRQNELVLVVDRCAMLTRDFADLPEAQEAALILGSLKNNPIQLQQAADALSERLGEMYLALAETHLKKGQPQRAEYYFRRVVLTSPGSRQAETAQVRLTQIESLAPRSSSGVTGSGLTSANESK